MNVKKVAIGSDHAGFIYKAPIIKMLEEMGIEVLDKGPKSSESVDYPDYAHPVAGSVEMGETDLGIVLCGSGNGVAMSANKHANIRCALAWTPEIAELGRLHNDANVLSIPARFVSEFQALNMAKVFVETNFEGGRHARRVNKIACAV